MGLLDFLKKKPEKEEDKPSKGKKEKDKQASSPEDALMGRFNEECALCGKAGTEKKWAGQYWHKKCLRAARKGAKGML